MVPKIALKQSVRQATIIAGGGGGGAQLRPSKFMVEVKFELEISLVCTLSQETTSVRFIKKACGK